MAIYHQLVDWGTIGSIVIGFLKNKSSQVGTNKTHIGKKPLTFEATIKRIHHWLKKLKQPRPTQWVHYMMCLLHPLNKNLRDNYNSIHTSPTQRMTSLDNVVEIFWLLMEDSSHG
jgi:hypothetical protein